MQVGSDLSGGLGRNERGLGVGVRWVFESFPEEYAMKPEGTALGSCD